MNAAVQDGIQVEILPCQDVQEASTETDVMVKIIVPVHSSARRAPVDVVCCIDISGSMSSIAEYEDVETG